MRSWKWQGVNHVFLCDCDRLVSGAGDIKLTKDGNVLLHEMVNYLADYSFVVKVFIEIDKMYWLFAGSISRILWCLEPICPATVNCRFILTSFYLFTRKLCQKATIFFWRKKNSAEIKSSNLHHHALEFVKNWEKEIKISVYLQHFYIKVWVM